MIVNGIAPRGLLAASLLGVAVLPAGAQERLVGFRTANVGLVWETVSFGSGGIAQSSAFGSGSIVKSASQWSIPMSVIVPFGDWAWAAGLSYEVRGRFAPVAALSAGLPSPDFDPGDALHFSLATDGLL